MKNEQLSRRQVTDLPVRNCRICGDPMKPGGTRRIGVCVECVAEVNYSRRKIKTPGYYHHG
jgi:hypothetical protein